MTVTAAARRAGGRAASGSDQPAEAQGRGQRLARRAEVDDPLGSEALERADRRAVVAELGVVVVLDDERVSPFAPSRAGRRRPGERTTPVGNWCAGVTTHGLGFGAVEGADVDALGVDANRQRLQPGPRDDLPDHCVAGVLDADGRPARPLEDGAEQADRLREATADERVLGPTGDATHRGRGTRRAPLAAPASLGCRRRRAPGRAPASALRGTTWPTPLAGRPRSPAGPAAGCSAAAARAAPASTRRAVRPPARSRRGPSAQHEVPLRSELGVGADHEAAGDAELCGERAGRWKRCFRLQPALANRRAKLALELRGQRLAELPVQRDEQLGGAAQLVHEIDTEVDLNNGQVGVYLGSEGTPRSAGAEANPWGESCFAARPARS